MNNTTDPRDIIYTPAEISTIGLRYLEQRRSNKTLGIPLGLASIDADLLPMLPGELITIIGRPGNGKTGIMMRWARERAAWLRLNEQKNRIVIYATWEQSIEDLHAFDLAADTAISITDMARGNISDDQWSRMLASSMNRIDKPLWYIGHSIERRKKRPHISVIALENSLRSIEDWTDERYEIDMIFADYLQRIPFDGRVESKTIGLDDILNKLKDCALEFGCPMVAGVQARREVDEREVPIPMMDDGQWSSAIEQVSDKCLSVVRPRKYRQDGEFFGKKKPVMVQGENQMIVTLLKQKLGLSNKSYWVSFNPIYNRLDELEMRSINDRND
jgi:replicative DNA helicase